LIGTIIIFLLIFFVIVMGHEFGHFLIAKVNGIRVNEFAIGMGPKIAGFKKGETEYVLRAFPLGGACIFEGEDGLETAKELRIPVYELLREGEKFTPKKWEAQIKELTQEYEKQSRRYGRSTVNLAYVELLRHNRKMDERDQKNKDQSQSRQHEKMDRGQKQKKKHQEMEL